MIPKPLIKLGKIILKTFNLLDFCILKMGLMDMKLILTD